MRFISYNVSDSYYEFIGENNEKYIVPQTDIILVEEENSISVKNIASRQTIGYLVKAVVPPTPTFKVKITTPSGDTTEIACNDDPTLKSSDVSGYPSFSNYEIGTCVTTINAYTFYTKLLGDLIFNEGLETIGDGAFKECHFQVYPDITIPSTVSSLGEDAFDQTIVNSITFLSVTPPTTVGSYFLPSTFDGIFVPDESVDAYKAAWTNYAARIKPISEK